MKRGETFVVLSGFLVVCVKDFVTTSGYRHLLESSIILLVVCFAFLVQQNVKSGKPNSFRSDDTGLWVCLLLPSVANGMEMEDRSLLWTLVLTSLVVYVYREGLKMSRSQCILVAVVYICLTADLMYHKPLDAVAIAICCIIYMYILNNISYWFKNSFTFGEACVVVQLYMCQTYRGIRSVRSSDPLEKIAVVVYVGLHVAVLSLYLLSKKQCSALVLWPVMAVIAGAYLLTAGVLYLEMADIYRLLNNVIATDISAVLLCWWSLWLMSSVMLVCFHGNKHSETLCKKSSYHHLDVKSEEKSVDKSVAAEQIDYDADDAEEKYKQIPSQETDTKTTISSETKSKRSKNLNKNVYGSPTAVSVRKFFHVAMICVFVPGLMLSPNLLYLASIAIAAVLIILEVIRVLKLPPFGPILEENLWVFLDDQDTGDLILTPIYLLVGCSLPLWWNYKVQKPPCSLSVYAGLISVGVGDGVASVFGRKYGIHKWPGRKKSVEGTSAAVISQIIAIQLLSFGNIPGAVVSMEMILCVVLISMLEALTSQIDNLVIPIFAWILLATVEPTY